MPMYKRCDSCGKRLTSGTACECTNKRRHAEYNLTRSDGDYASYYSSKQWRVARAAAISACNGLDLYSLYEHGIAEVGYTVHHVIPLKDDWSKRTDVTNLIYLTESNHKALHKLMESSSDEKHNVILLLQNIIKKHNTARNNGCTKG